MRAAPFLYGTSPEASGRSDRWARGDAVGLRHCKGAVGRREALLSFGAACRVCVRGGEVDSQELLGFYMSQ